MNVSEFSNYENRINLIQAWYLVFVVFLIGIVVIILNLFKNVVSLEFNGVIIDKNIVQISKLSKEQINLMLDSKKIIIQDDSVNYQIIEFEESNDNYSLKLLLNNIYLKEKELKIKFILKEEKLYEFIFEAVKGDI